MSADSHCAHKARLSTSKSLSLQGPNFLRFVKRKPVQQVCAGGHTHSDYPFEHAQCSDQHDHTVYRLKIEALHLRGKSREIGVCSERSNAQYRTGKEISALYVWNKAFACLRVEKHPTGSVVMSTEGVRQTVSVSVSIKSC